MTDWEEQTNIAEHGTSARLLLPGNRRPALVMLTGISLGQVVPLAQGVSIIGRTSEAALQIPDEGVSREHARVVVDGDSTTIEDLNSRNGTFINGAVVGGQVPLVDGDRIQLGHSTFVRFALLDIVEEAFQEHLHQSSVRDGLTGIYNKRYFHERLATELPFARRHRTELSLLLLDLDHFKKINDTYGHLAGDQVLVATAQALTATLRAEDVVARYGGEELAVLLRGIPPANARLTAERLRKVLEALVITTDDGRTVRVTASIGVAAFSVPTLVTPEALVGAADRSMYAAKAAGRNRVGD